MQFIVGNLFLVDDRILCQIKLWYINLYSHAPFLYTLFYIYFFWEDIAFKCISLIFGHVSFILRDMPEDELA